mmetsp:Transcript_10061/g.25736  ORF Transcript_10061/g.25736 Transcript_10061/m.25736 type:complete len:394 (+) Transcript_10061:227-1408(+)
MLRGRGARLGRRKKAGQLNPDGTPVRSAEVPEHLRYVIDAAKIEVLREQFETFDSDGSGLISHDELMDFLRCLGHNPVERQLKELVAEFDKDGNGDLSFGEFVALWHGYLVEADMERNLIQKAFEFFDADGDEGIDTAEFQEAMTTLGDPLTQAECDAFFALMDIDANGVIDFTEFSKFVVSEGAFNEISPAPHRHGASDSAPLPLKTAAPTALVQLGKAAQGCDASKGASGPASPASSSRSSAIPAAGEGCAEPRHSRRDWCADAAEQSEAEQPRWGGAGLSRPSEEARGSLASSRTSSRGGGETSGWGVRARCMTAPDEPGRGTHGAGSHEPRRSCSDSTTATPAPAPSPAPAPAASAGWVAEGDLRDTLPAPDTPHVLEEREQQASGLRA